MLVLGSVSRLVGWAGLLGITLPALFVVEVLGSNAVCATLGVAAFCEESGMEFWQELEPGVRWAVLFGVVVLLGLFLVRACSHTPDVPTLQKRGIPGAGMN
jgi:hypothetical protein